MGYSDELGFAVDVVQKASVPAMAAFGSRELAVFEKSDGTIVTQADLDVNALIVEAIQTAYSSDAILSEEGPQATDTSAASRCWIVDPIDGTTHFYRKDRDWSIMLALTVDQRAVVGAVYRPALDELYAGAFGEESSFRVKGRETNVRIDPIATGPFRVIHGPSAVALTQLSRSSNEVCFTVAHHGLMGILNMFSSGAHAFVTARTTGHEWDLAPYAAILAASGGLVPDLQGRLHTFNKVDSKILGGVIAAVSEEIHDRIMTLVGEAGLVSS